MDSVRKFLVILIIGCHHSQAAVPLLVLEVERKRPRLDMNLRGNPKHGFEANPLLTDVASEDGLCTFPYTAYCPHIFFIEAVFIGVNDNTVRVYVEFEIGFMTLCCCSCVVIILSILN